MNDRDDNQDAPTNPVKEMFLLALLYLPLGFFLWFWMASGLMFPVARLSEWLLTGFYPELFERVLQLGHTFEIHTLVVMSERVQGRQAALNLEINPMIYAWGIPLLFGLIMATPQRALRRVGQLLAALAAGWLVTTWGVFWEVWVDLAFRAGAEGAAAAQSAGPPPNVIALCYQLGFLILPGVVPLATWILMNRPFIEMLVRRPAR